MNKLFFFLLFLLPLPLKAQNPDIYLLRKINMDRNKNMDESFRAISKSSYIIDIAAPIVVWSTGFIRNDCQIKADGFTIAASLLATTAISYSLKYGINRTRPYVTHPDIQNLSIESDPSFPSGHTSAAFSTATSLSLAYPKWYIIIPAYSWATAVAYSRMDLGLHYPSDVLAGALIGTGCAYLCHKGQQWLTNRKKKNQVPVTPNNF